MDSPEASLRTGIPNSLAPFGAHSQKVRPTFDHSGTTANSPEADGRTERTNLTLIQCLRLCTHENLSEWLDFLPCAEWVYNTPGRSTTRCASPCLAYTQALLSDPVLDLAVGSQPFSGAGEEFREHLRTARECMRQAQERQARNYDKRRSAVTFEPGDLVLVDTRSTRFARRGPDKEVRRPLGGAVCCPCTSQWAGIHAGVTSRMEMP